jgi:hypothetical protein
VLLTVAFSFDAFFSYQPGLLFQYEPELDAFLEFLIWRFSIWADKPTPGNALMNLRYRDERAAPITGKEGVSIKAYFNIFRTATARGHRN